MKKQNPNLVESFFRKEPSEVAILFITMLLSGYMFVESLSFGSDVGRFPRIVAAITLVCAALLLLGPPASNLVVKVIDDTSVIDYQISPTSILTADKTDSSSTIMNQTSDGSSLSDKLDKNGDREEIDIRKLHITIYSVIGYGILSYLISILYSTPIFVLFYTIWTKQPWYLISVLTLMSFIIGYGFMEILIVPMDDGYLTDAFLQMRTSK